MPKVKYPHERDQILMGQKQLQRFGVMGLVEAGRITLKEGADKVGRSHRQAKRVWNRVSGVPGLANMQ